MAPMAYVTVVFMTGIGVVCLVAPSRVQQYAIRALRDSSEWQRRYVKSPWYLWHVRFCGVCGLLGGGIAIYALLFGK